MTLRDYLGKIGQGVFQYQTPRLKKRGEELFPLLDQTEHQSHHGRVRRLLEWLVIPPTLWLVDYVGLSKIIARRLNQKEPIDPRMLELIDELEELPGLDEQAHAVQCETTMQTGDYGGFLRNAEKYRAMARGVANHPKRVAHWARIEKLFKLGKFRNHKKGVIRRTQYLERGVPPEDFYLTDASDEERWLFRAIFDLYCSKYGLFGMKFSEALVEHLTITRTRFTTNISIPRWLNVARDDIKWESVLETHWNPDLTRQGPKASGNELEKLEMFRRIDAARTQAKSENLEGEPFRRRVEELAQRPITDKRIHIRWQNEINKLKEKGML